MPGCGFAGMKMPGAFAPSVRAPGTFVTDDLAVFVDVDGLAEIADRAIQRLCEVIEGDLDPVFTRIDLAVCDGVLPFLLLEHARDNPYPAAEAEGLGLRKDRYLKADVLSLLLSAVDPLSLDRQRKVRVVELKCERVAVGRAQGQVVERLRFAAQSRHQSGAGRGITVQPLPSAGVSRA
jgi:hypothetical protein